MIAPSASDTLSRTLLLTRDLVRDAKVTDDQLVRALQGTTVCIVANAANASTSSGQATVTTLAALVAMMGMHVRLVLPDLEVVGNQPPLAHSALLDGVRLLVNDSTPGATATIDTGSGQDDLVFVLGSTPWQDTARDSWRLSGSAWTGSIGPTLSEGRTWQADVPFGGLVAASLAAMEAYKATLRKIEPSEFVRATRAVSISLGPDIAIPDFLDLGRIDVVSGGAITNAMMHALLRVRGLRAEFRVFEPEQLDATNLNRYALALRSMLGWDKIAILASHSTSSLRI